MGLVALGGGRLDPDEAPLEPWVQMEDKVEEGMVEDLVANSDLRNEKNRKIIKDKKKLFNLTIFSDFKVQVF